MPIFIIRAFLSWFFLATTLVLRFYNDWWRNVSFRWLFIKRCALRPTWSIPLWPLWAFSPWLSIIRSVSWALRLFITCPTNDKRWKFFLVFLFFFLLFFFLNGRLFFYNRFNLFLFIFNLFNFFRYFRNNRFFNFFNRLFFSYFFCRFFFLYFLNFR